ncbi:MAG: pyruvate dehydrogenase (acetyl-transferring) E1 component subunit alpha [Candidatus ainarchaeum sp.]|nr:pyruvate dehydrogenase (acetyl-transferring) E1 component subunit alpha [Candidatus ainarchaeum sp.]
MAVSRIYEGHIDYMQVLDKDGGVDAALEPAIPRETLEKIYYSLVLARAWDRKCLALQRTGRMYTYAPLEGQEAVSVGVCFALRPEDWLFPTYRESFAYHLRGFPLDTVNLGWMGMEEGLKLDRKMRCFPYAVPIGSQLPHAVGGAYAAKMRGEKCAVVVCCGDGGTSEGDFHDALNFAGVLNTPNVFVISNNQYAISTPRKWQTKSETIAQKALAYGLKGLQVDGNDVLAVYKAVKEAADGVREGKPAVLLEMITYRMGPHTTSDDPKKYRDTQEEAYWRDRDPIRRFQAYLKGKGIWSDDFEKKVQESAAKAVEDAVAKAEAFRPDPKDMFRFVFAHMTKNVEDQMKECFGERQ